MSDMSELSSLRKALQREIAYWRERDHAILKPLDEHDEYSKALNRGFGIGHNSCADRLELILDNFGGE